MSVRRHRFLSPVRNGTAVSVALVFYAGGLQICMHYDGRQITEAQADDLMATYLQKDSRVNKLRIDCPHFSAKLFCQTFPPHSLARLFLPAHPDRNSAFFPRAEPSQTIDSPPPISENGGYRRHSACPSLVHAHAPCRRGHIGFGEHPRQQPATASRAPRRRRMPTESRTLRVGLIAGPEATWDLAVARVGSTFATSGQALEVYHAWDCVDLGVEDPTDYDCLVLLGWPAADHRSRTGRRRMKRIELFCRGGGSLVEFRAMRAEIPGWSNFAEEVLGGRQPVGQQCRLLEVERSDSAW